MKLTTFMTWMSFTLCNHILPTGVIAVKVSTNKATLKSFQEAFKFKFFLSVRSEVSRLKHGKRGPLNVLLCDACTSSLCVHPVLK